MLQATVLPLSVFSNDDDVNPLVSGVNTREGVAVHHVGKQIQICAMVQNEKKKNTYTNRQ